MERELALQEVRKRISCKQHLKKSKSGLYQCPYCGSGRGTNGTGAVKVYENTNTFCCFSCGKTGDVLDLMQNESGADFNTAFAMAAAECGIEIDNGSTQAHMSNDKGVADKNITQSKTEPQNASQSVTEALQEDFTEYYKECRARLSDPAAVSYLSARGISKETAAAAWIGYDPKADPAKSNHATPRVIIPVTKYHFIGRRIDGVKDFAKLNNKGATPGVFNAAALYKKHDAIFVVEGAFDALSLMEIGEAAIALNSTSNASTLIKMLEERRTLATLVICLDKDADPRTREKVEKAAEVLREGFKRLHIAYKEADIAGEHKDANEALTAGRAAFVERVAAALREERKTDIDRFLESIQTEAYKPAATGIKFFDELLSGGIVNKTLTILLAAPAAGKTTLCQQVAEAMAMRKRPVVYLNLEMSKEQMLAKSISSMLARKNTYKSTLGVLQGYNWTDQEREQITEAAREYEKTIYPYLKYYDAADIGSGVNSILQHLEEMGARAVSEGRQAPAIIVDYLHLLTNDTGKNTDIQELIKLAVVGLKQYAINYNTFVIAISATNRTSNTGKLTLDSARDSSNIDFTGDYAISLNYEDIDNGKVSAADIDKLQQEKPRRMILRVVKGRFIQSGNSVNVYFNTACNLFYANDDFMPAGDIETPFDKPKNRI